MSGHGLGRRLGAVGGAMAVLATPELALAKGVAPFVVEAGTRYESLSNAYAPWREHDATLRWRPEARRAAWLTARVTDRFALLDQTLEAGLAWPATERLTLTFDGGVSPSAQVVPAWQLGAQAAFALPFGAVAGLFARESRWTQARAQRAGLMWEQYAGDCQATLTASLTRLPDFAPTGGDHWLPGALLALGWAPAEDRALTLYLGRGGEAQALSPTRFLAMDVTGATLAGRLGLPLGLVLTGDVGFVRQAPVYDRLGGRLGLAVGF